MAWSNYPNYLLDKLLEELLLLAVSLVWVLLRLFRVLGVKNVEKGKPILIKIAGKKFIEIKGRKSLEEHRELLAKEKIQATGELDILKKDNPT
jgi:hypothetical protein